VSGAVRRGCATSASADEAALTVTDVCDDIPLVRKRGPRRAPARGAKRSNDMLAFLSSPKVAPILLLCASNLFMTTAWYGHLRFPGLSMPAAILMGWSIALLEYCLAVPANRIGYGAYSAAQLKTFQEIITLVIFVGFSALVLGEAPTLRTLFGFLLIAAGAFVIFQSK
jgi:uncharacterized protein (DUF486 family)